MDRIVAPNLSIDNSIDKMQVHVVISEAFAWYKTPPDKLCICSLAGQWKGQWIKLVPQFYPLILPLTVPFQPVRVLIPLGVEGQRNFLILLIAEGLNFLFRNFLIFHWAVCRILVCIE